MKMSFKVMRPHARLGLLTSICLLASSGCVARPPATPVATLMPVPAATQVPSKTLPAYSSGTAVIQSTEIPAVDTVEAMLNEVDGNRVMLNLKRLTGAEAVCNENGCNTIANRLTGSDGLGWAKDYVSGELSALGYKVEFSDWSTSGYADQNIIARKTGVSLPNEEIYFVAHLDGVKKFWANRFPAADDNASGVVDLLELARVLSNHSFDRTVVLMFSTGEEQGDLGVGSYVEQLSPQQLDAIKYVVDVDMVGYDGNGDGVMQLWSGDDAPSLTLAQMLSKVVEAYQPALVPSVVTGCT